jgi:hypothetical protein
MNNKILICLMLLCAQAIPTFSAKLAAYLMVYHKDQDHGLHMAYSEDGYTWTALNDDKPIFDGERQGHEAPNCWKRLGTDTYVVMYDNYRMRPMNFEFTETKDFIHYQPIGYFDGKDSKMKHTNFSEQKHGAVTYITKKMLKRLKKMYGSSTSSDDH